MLIDYHLHNHFSPDSQADTAEMLQVLASKGIGEACFTNHAEWFDNQSEDIERRLGVFDFYEASRRFESILWELEQLQPQFPTIALKLGAEITYNPKHLADLERFIQATPFDFLLGSVHQIDGVIINSARTESQYFEGKTETEAYSKYFDQLHELVTWGHFDAVAHFDVIKKYGHCYFGPFEPKKYEAVIQKTLKLMAEKSIGIELNSRCMHGKCEELFPHPVILKWALKAGIDRFTLSSDAHEAKDAGDFVEEALQAARHAGIETICTYEKRKPFFHPLTHELPPSK